jgi:hypothetical protein
VEDTMAISSESKDVSCENLRDSSNNCQTLWHAPISKVDWVLPST